MTDRAPVDDDRRGPSSTGLNPRTAATLAYLAWWITGLIFWALEKENRFVRFHARQSVLALGGVSLVALIVGSVALSMVFISGALFTFFLGVFWFVWFGGLLLWVVLMINAWRGRKCSLPLVGDLAERSA